MRGLPPVTIRTTERRFRSGPNLLSDLKVLAVDGLAPKWFSFSTTQDSMGNEWITVIYQRSGPTAYYVRGSLSSELKPVYFSFSFGASLSLSPSLGLSLSSSFSLASSLSAALSLSASFLSLAG